MFDQSGRKRAETKLNKNKNRSGNGKEVSREKRRELLSHKEEKLRERQIKKNKERDRVV